MGGIFSDIFNLQVWGIGQRPWNRENSLPAKASPPFQGFLFFLDFILKVNIVWLTGSGVQQGWEDLSSRSWKGEEGVTVKEQRRGKVMGKVDRKEKKEGKEKKAGMGGGLVWKRWETWILFKETTLAMTTLGVVKAAGKIDSMNIYNCQYINTSSWLFCQERIFEQPGWWSWQWFGLHRPSFTSIQLWLPCGSDTWTRKIPRIPTKWTNQPIGELSRFKTRWQSFSEETRSNVMLDHKMNTRTIRTGAKEKDLQALWPPG